jgi:hypothetical protein
MSQYILYDGERCTPPDHPSQHKPRLPRLPVETIFALVDFRLPYYSTTTTRLSNAMASFLLARVDPGSDSDVRNGRGEFIHFRSRKGGTMSPGDFGRCSSSFLRLPVVRSSIRCSDGRKCSIPAIPARNDSKLSCAREGGCVTEVSRIWPKVTLPPSKWDSGTRKQSLTCVYTVPDVTSNTL